MSSPGKLQSFFSPSDEFTGVLSWLLVEESWEERGRRGGRASARVERSIVRRKKLTESLPV